MDDGRTGRAGRPVWWRRAWYRAGAAAPSFTWRGVARALLRVLAVWAVGSATLAVLAGLLPDLTLESPRGGSPTDIVLAATAGAGTFGLLNALVWPLLVRALLLVPAYVLGLSTFMLNGLLFLIALSVVPYGDTAASTPETAVVVAAVMSATSSAASTWLAVRDDDAHRRRLARLAGRRRADRAHTTTTPGTVIIQLDGVGHDVLRDAMRVRQGGSRGNALKPPLMETLTRWTATTHTLTPWHTDWSSQTGASQLGILHGSNEDVPAFRWYEKETGQVMVCNRPSSAAELQRRAVHRTGGPGLLAVDAASRGNLFTGGADQLALVLSVAVRRDRGHRSRSGYFAYFSDPAHAARTAISFAAEVAREIGQSLRARIRERRSPVGRGGLYPVLRAFATVVERDVVVAAVIGDILAGRRTVYADLVAYDEVAHHSGPRERDTDQVLRRLDRTIGLIAGTARYAPRPYRFVLLSDHGQSPGTPFAAAYGISLRDLVRSGCRLPGGGRVRGAAEEERESSTAARAALRRPERGESRGTGGGEIRGHGGGESRRPGRDGEVGGREEEAGRRDGEAGRREHRVRGRDAGPVVLGSGNLGLISFPEAPGRLTRQQIDRLHPGLLRRLADHPGIGFVLVRDARCGPVVLGADGAEHELATGRITGADPLAPFGEGAARAVLRTDGFPHAADIMVNSAYDPRTGEVHAFEEQVGSHGGLGGEQSRPFLLYPRELSAPPSPLVGAESVHAVLRDWIALEDLRSDAAPTAAFPGQRDAYGIKGGDLVQGDA
ncbi:phage holin family protein [Streptomyces sp. PTM05]|uniref:Phage holin family protein n=1 Tax=Streptantibioticus parmotrematis TaxID=2873249 RepID=A0ABS7QXH8_9ACTN|nr:phage holin family protein [Streptantibioticus parmotrematis]MBY8887643.1 phage holin family protein [Streptantibioticus parmotrematis]